MKLKHLLVIFLGLWTSSNLTAEGNNVGAVGGADGANQQDEILEIKRAHHSGHGSAQQGGYGYSPKSRGKDSSKPQKGGKGDK